MLGFNNNINLCNRFATSIYLCYITVYVPLCNKENTAKQSIHIHAEIVNKDDKNDSDDKESGRQW